MGGTILVPAGAVHYAAVVETDYATGADRTAAAAVAGEQSPVYGGATAPLGLVPGR